MEFRRAGYKVVVPHQDWSWILHDDGFINLVTYFDWRDVFLREYKDMIAE